MKIDFTVTKRDKNLLAGLAVCAAVFCFYWFGVKPQMDCLDKLEVQQEALEMQQLHLFWKIFFRKPTRPSLPLRKAPPFTPALSPLERGSNRPTRYSEPLRSKVGGTKRSSPVRVGIGRKGSLWQQLINYDFLSA